MKIEYELQNDVLKGKRINYLTFENCIMLTDGHVGCYFKPDEIKIDLSKITEVKDTKIADSDELMKTYQEAEKTRYAISTPDHKLLVRITGKNSNRKSYVPESQLKMFYGYTGIMISDNDRAPVLIMKYGIPYGIILPVRVFDYEE